MSSFVEKNGGWKKGDDKKIFGEKIMQDLRDLENAIHAHGYPFKQKYLKYIAKAEALLPDDIATEHKYRVLVYCWDTKGWRVNRDGNGVVVKRE